MTVWTAPSIASLKGDNTLPLQKIFRSLTEELRRIDTATSNLTGDVTSVGTVTTLTNAPVIAKVLTGYVSGAGTVASSDSILQAIQKLNGNDATNANLTGHITSAGNVTALGSFTSLQLKTAVTDETGSGALVFGTSPAITTPTGIVKGDVGLGSVDNTADTAKPVSTAQQAALNLKQNSLGSWTAFTPVWAGVTSTGATNSGLYCLFNNILFFRAQYVVGTSPTIGAIKLTIPNSKVMSGSPTPQMLPSLQCNFVSLLAQPHVGQVFYTSSTQIELRAINTAGAYAQTVTTTAAIPFTWAQYATIEISGWVQVN